MNENNHVSLSKSGPTATMATLGREAVLRRVREMVQSGEPLRDQHDIKFLWHGDNLAKVLAGHPFDARPVTMELDATLDCNYACPFCTYADWEKRTEALAGTRAMSRENMELVLQRMADGGVRGVIFTGGGEPLMNPNTAFGLEHARTLRLQSGLFTNGSLLTPSLIERLLAAGPQFLRISANAVTPEVYSRFHGLRDQRFAVKVWENIREIAGRIGEAKTSFGLGVVVNHINADDLMRLIQRALGIVADGGRIDYVAVRPVVNYGGQHQISHAVVETVKRARDQGVKLIGGSPPRLHFAMEYFERVAEAGEHPLPPPTATHCVGHPWMASVGYTGDVYLCSEGKGNPQNRLGNLLEQTLDEIWNSAHRQHVLCGSCQRPPVCKAHRLTTRLEPLLEAGPLNSEEIALVQTALDEMRSAGAPDGMEFL
jgi:radical SAM protein with 4Fe4S-binding SPASM domain